MSEEVQRAIEELKRRQNMTKDEIAEITRKHVILALDTMDLHDACRMVSETNLLVHAYKVVLSSSTAQGLGLFAS